VQVSHLPKVLFPNQNATIQEKRSMKLVSRIALRLATVTPSSEITTQLIARNSMMISLSDHRSHRSRQCCQPLRAFANCGSLLVVSGNGLRHVSFDDRCFQLLILDLRHPLVVVVVIAMIAIGFN